MTIANRLLPVMSYLFLALMLVGGVVRITELIRTSEKIRRHVRSLRAVDYRRFQDSDHIMPVSLILPAAEADGEWSAEELITTYGWHYQFTLVLPQRPTLVLWLWMHREGTNLARTRLLLRMALQKVQSTLGAGEGAPQPS